MNEPLRRTIGTAWAFRTRVEREAAERFARLGPAIASWDAASPVVALMERAAGDERRHAAFCAELAGRYGDAVGSEWPAAGNRMATSSNRGLTWAAKSRGIIARNSGP